MGILVGRRWATIMACAVGAGLLGCAHNNNQAHLQQMLSASGFQLKLADTPEKLAHVQSFPQRRITSVEHDGQLKFVWADAQDCRCMYVGTEGNYQSYARLAEQEKISHENYEAAQATANWATWQPGWGPEWWWW